MENSSIDRETLSVCMIVKDEEKTLEQAIMSVKSIANEIIIGVDNKSNEETNQIAKKYADVHFRFDFNDNFSSSRNLAIERATGSLILILDGHEYISPDDDPLLENVVRMSGIDPLTERVLTPLCYLESLKRNGLSQEFDVCCFNLCMNVGDDRIPQIFFLQPRLFRNAKGIKYESAVHNHLVGYDESKSVGCPEVVIVHNMPEEREKKRIIQRKKMNFRGLMADLKKDPSNPRPYFYLGNTYADMGDRKKAMHWYSRYIKKSGFNEERYQALQQLAVIVWRENKDKEKALDYALEAIKLNPKRREPYILFAEIAIDEKKWDLALQYIDQAECIDAPHTVMFLQGAVYTYMLDMMRSRVYSEMQDWDNAMKSIDKILKWRPGDHEVLKSRWTIKENMKTKYSKDEGKNILVVDRIGSFTKDIIGHFRATGRNCHVEPFVIDRWYNWADFVWIEWADQNAIEVGVRASDIPVVVRLHSYEAFTDIPGAVNWSNIDCLVFVAPHIRDLVLSKWPEIQNKTATAVIPNGIDVDKIPFMPKARGNKIAYVGYLNEKKNVPLLIECARAYPDYEFHVAGQFQSENLSYWFSDAIQSLPNLWWHGWLEGDDARNQFFKDKHFIISPSIVESFGYSIVEGMAMGLKPLIAKRQGTFWEDTFEGVGDLKRLLEGEYTPKKYRNFVEENYSLGKQVQSIENLTQTLIYKAKVKRSGIVQDEIKYTSLIQESILT